jgi:hypothetical protein
MVKVNCLNCGREFNIYPSTLKWHKTKCCSFKCRNKYHHKEITCKQCGKTFQVIKSSKRQFCSLKCSCAYHINFRNPTWKGGRFTQKHGYIMVYIGNGKYRFEHDLIMEKYLGRSLDKNERCHHKNAIRNDNRIENLELVTISEHTSKYHPQKKDTTKWKEVRCLNCKNLFQKRIIRIKYRPTHFCSHKCYEEHRRSQEKEKVK